MEPLSSQVNEGKTKQEGWVFNWFNFLLGVAVWLSFGKNLFSDDWTFCLYLSIVVIIHELGHVILGKSFGCSIKEMQVFFLPFVSYLPRKESRYGSSWRNIKWSLGVLPLGGVTVFKTRATDDFDEVFGLEADYTGMDMNSNTSPYLEDKPAWQRLLISAAGVFLNIATFLVLYFTLPYMSFACFGFFLSFAIYSFLLGVLNILPVYPLDGGAIVFALFEMITGKKPSPGFTKVCSSIGFVFIVLFFWVFPEWLGTMMDWVIGLFF